MKIVKKIKNIKMETLTIYGIDFCNNSIYSKTNNDEFREKYKRLSTTVCGLKIDVWREIGEVKIKYKTSLSKTKVFKIEINTFEMAVKYIIRNSSYECKNLQKELLQIMKENNI